MGLGYGIAQGVVKAQVMLVCCSGAQGRVGSFILGISGLRKTNVVLSHSLCLEMRPIETADCYCDPMYLS